jgi:hypothetical protein
VNEKSFMSAKALAADVYAVVHGKSDKFALASTVLPG